MSDSSGRPAETWLYRIVHVGNLATLLARGGLHAPNATPDDDRPYRTIHNTNVQAGSPRSSRALRAGRHDPRLRSALFRAAVGDAAEPALRAGRGYDEGQAPLVYLLTSVERVRQAGARWVFADGHGLAAPTTWYDDLDHLAEVDWDLVGARYWADSPEDNDRRRRKQAEFLVRRHLPWSALAGIAVMDEDVRGEVQAILATSPAGAGMKVAVRPNWYY